MPTGYTAKIADGISFQEYALTCARAFGATISMRDEPLTTPIPDKFKADEYHAKNARKSAARIAKLQLMTDAQCKKEADKEYNARIIEYRAGIERREKLRKQYEDMLAKAKKYKTPSKSHAGFKAFMISQIEDSINGDCGGDYYQNALASLKQLCGRSWRKREISYRMKDIRYHAKHFRKESSNAKDKTVWIQKLKKSIAEVN